AFFVPSCHPRPLHSCPTRRSSDLTVIDRTNAVYLERCPEGALPSQTVAYRRVTELDKGRYTFGSAKQRRSVAGRPQGVLGRLQRSEEHTSELQSRFDLVCRPLLEN